MPTAAHQPSYRHVAWCYDLLASGYSLGAIDRAKRSHHKLIEPGMRVLYAGAGRGREIAGAVARGAEVTCVEPCPVMAERLHNRLATAGERFTIVPRPIQAIHAQDEYDLVVAHFFLNVFDQQTMPNVLEHLLGMVKPGGRIVVADFKPSTMNESILKPIDRVWRSVYYRPVNLAGWLLRICALHPIYDYGSLIETSGFEREAVNAFAVLPGLPSLYQSEVFRRPEAS